MTTNGEDRPAKAQGAFRTIGELSGELGVPQHILRYWESRFPQLRPIQRAGKRRYYRPEDVALVRRIHALLSIEGYTVRGVQQMLDREGSGKGRAATGPGPAPAPPPAPPPTPAPATAATADAPAAPDVTERKALQRIRDMLSVALDAD